MADELRKVVNDPKRLWELEDTTLQVLIEAEKPIKAELLGRLLRALADGKLTPQEFDAISLLLISGSVPSLLAIPEFFEMSNGEVALHGGDTRRIEPLLLSLGVASRNGTKLEISEFGKLLNDIGFPKRR